LSALNDVKKKTEEEARKARDEAKNLGEKTSEDAKKASRKVSGQ